MEQGFDRLLARQDAVEQGFDGLLTTARTLAADFETHTQMLQQATNTTNELLDTLEETTDTATSLTKTLAGFGSGNWWPYFLCPAFTVVVGSYGLEPSAFRNFWLGAIGELAGFLISAPSSERLGKEFNFSFLTSPNTTALKI